MTLYERELIERLREVEDLLRREGLVDGAHHVAMDRAYVADSFERLKDNATRISELEGESMDFDEKEMAYLDRQRADTEKIARASFALGQLSGMLSNTVDKLRDKGIISETTAQAGKDEMFEIINKARLND